jgi:hypothetical protein
VTASNRKEYIEAAKAAFLNLAVRGAVLALTAEFPFLAIPWVKGLFERLVRKIIKAGIEKGETGIFFVYVDFRVDRQASAFVEAALNNYRVQQTGTDQEKHEAEERLIAAFDDFVKLNRV